jgi:ketosteroid isomerase-like protein
VVSKPSWIAGLFKAIDAKDADRFVSYIAEDGTFAFGNAPAAAGRAAIREVVAGFFGSIRGLSHEVLEVAEAGGGVWSRGIVTYVRHDGSTLTAPFCNHFEMKGDKVKHYRIYVDASKLYA